MTKGEILKKAIEKAYKISKAGTGFLFEDILDERELEDNNYYRVIFSQDFLVRFFGKKIFKNVHGYNYQLAWAYHAQEMVVYPLGPLKYLEKFFMNNKQILKQVIEKAIKNGFDFDIKGRKFEVQKMDDDYIVIVDNKWRHDKNTIIFNPDFAKAFWGEKFYGFPVDVSENAGDKGIPIWQHYLQEMVIKKDKLKYLEKFL